MPTIVVDRKDFCSLLGKDMPMDEIEKRLPMLGVGWEGVQGDSFEVEVFPNRPDMLSVEGLARAFASFVDVSRGLKKYKAEQSEYLVKVDEKVAKIRPHFVSCIIKGVLFTDDFIKSIMQLQEKLHITHCRKRKKVAIGLHDFDKIHFPLLYTTKPKDFKFLPLEQDREMKLGEILENLPKGKDYAWILQDAEEYPIIIDAMSNVLSMPPIINSEGTKIEEKTRNVFVDITATDEKAASEVLNIIATAFADSGGRIYRVKIRYEKMVVETPNLMPKDFAVESEYINGLLGLDLNNKEISEYLQRMGYDAVETGKKIQVMVPCCRTDVMHPLDIVEDVAIAYGYENFEDEIPNIATTGGENDLEVFCSKLRQLMVGYGLQEVLTFILTNKDNLFEKMSEGGRAIPETSNPKTQEYNVARNSLLPSLIEVLSANKHNEYPQNLFEVGDVVVLDSSSETGARTEKRLAVVFCHSKASFSEIKSVVESVLRNLGVKEWDVDEGRSKGFVKGRKAVFFVDGKELVEFGEANPKVLDNWRLEMPVSGAEFFVGNVFEVVK